jgi:hypothetical protein
VQQGSARSHRHSPSSWAVSGGRVRVSVGVCSRALVRIRAGARSLADQCDGDEKQYSSFFSWYYFFLNVGAFAGESVSPMLREHVSYLAPYAVFSAVQVRTAHALFCVPASWATVCALVQLVSFGALMIGRTRFVHVDPPPLPESARSVCW